MDLRDCYNILFLILLTGTVSLSQTSEIQCINPSFDKLVDDYLDYSIPTISVADAYESKNQFIFLDAREIEEYKISHIEKSIHIGYNAFDLDALKATVPVDAKIIVYCSIGYRSEKIGEILKSNGFQSVYNLYGSIFEWVNQHHPIIDMHGNQTFNLHTYNEKWSKWVEGEEVVRIWED